MKMTSKFLVIICIITIAGCANVRTRPFEEPTQGPLAKIRVYQPQGGLAFLATFDESENCTQRRVLFSEKGSITEYKTIPAEQDFAFNLSSGTGRFNSCVMIGVFKPQENGFYSVNVQLDRKHCYVSVYRTLSEEGGTQINVPFTEKKFQAPWDETGSFCKE